MAALAVLTTILALLILTTASPTPRACTTAAPQTFAFPMLIDIRQDYLATNKYSSQLTFQIPANSYGCTLIARFPPGYPIESSGHSQVFIHAASGNAAGAHVGTVTFASDPRQETRVVVNSFQCQEVMSYTLSMGDEREAGRVVFEGTAEAGLGMEYGC